MKRVHPLFLSLVGLLNLACQADEPALPIDIKTLENTFSPATGQPRSLLSLETVTSGVTVADEGFAVRYAGEIPLLDGTVMRGEDIHGTVAIGPWPFAAKDSRLRVKRFREEVADVNSPSVFSLKKFFEPTTTNSEGWGPGDQGLFVLRLRLSATVRKQDPNSPQTTVLEAKPLGIYDTFLAIRMGEDGTLMRLPTILEGPAIHLVTSDHPECVTISLVTDVAEPASVVLNGSRKITGDPPKPAGHNWFRHEIAVEGLEADRAYHYFVQVGGTKSHTATFRTAPAKGASGFRFAFIGDSRAGVGNSMTHVSAVNVDVMERLCGVANREDVGLINQKSRLYGGCPEGYVMSEQLDWLLGRIRAAEKDPTVKFTVLFAHEPMFPNGKHTGDAMWYQGDNGSRAHVFSNGQVQREPLGVIQVRNTLARLISESAKVACVINSDEHAFYRTLISSQVPAGDDTDIDPKTDCIDWPDQKISPIRGLKRGTWYLVSGGGGAPYSAQLSSPWNTYWKAHAEPERGYRCTPQENILIFEVSGDAVSLTVRNAFGEKIDRVDNLMRVRHEAE